MGESGILAASTARQVSLSNLSINALRPAAQEKELEIGNKNFHS
jgi:hypothetical protein